MGANDYETKQQRIRRTSGQDPCHVNKKKKTNYLCSALLTTGVEPNKLDFDSSDYATFCHFDMVQMMMIRA